MRSSGAKRWLLSLGRHAVAEQGAAAAAAAATAEAGPSSAGLLPRGGGLLMRQMRAVSSGKASPATASAAGAAADGKTAVQRQERAFSAVPAPRKVDRPWHRRQDEKELGNLAEQRVRGPAAQQANGERAPAGLHSCACEASLQLQAGEVAAAAAATFNALCC